MQANSGLTIHERSHTREQPFKCEDCGKRSSSLSNHNAHCRRSHVSRPCLFQSCGIQFENTALLRVGSLVKHSIVFHSSYILEVNFQVLFFSCSDESNIFSNRSTLKTAMLILLATLNPSSSPVTRRPLWLKINIYGKALYKFSTPGAGTRKSDHFSAFSKFPRHKPIQRERHTATKALKP